MGLLLIIHKKQIMKIFTIVWIVWFLSELLLNRLFRSKMTNSKVWDKNSLKWIWITIIVSISLGVLSTIYLRTPLAKTGWINSLGLVLIICGMIIRFIAIRTLGKYFTVDLAVQNNHRLIKKGLYKYIRHPSYTGSLLSFLGLGLSLNNWVSLIVILIPVLVSFIYRIHIEEKLLLEQMGTEYSNYKNNTKRLIPMVY
jgi:protein-S-isoprenylcysteine O-methyltransferase Ste14